MPLRFPITTLLLLVLLVVILLVFLAGCGPSTPKTEPLEQLVQDFVYGSLALSPVTATATGYHEHNGAALDEMLTRRSTWNWPATRFSAPTP